MTHYVFARDGETGLSDTHPYSVAMFWPPHLDGTVLAWLDRNGGYVEPVWEDGRLVYDPSAAIVYMKGAVMFRCAAGAIALKLAIPSA